MFPFFSELILQLMVERSSTMSVSLLNWQQKVRFSSFTIGRTTTLCCLTKENTNFKFDTFLDNLRAYTYMVPSPKGSKSGKQQVKELYHGLQSCGLTMNRISVSLFVSRNFKMKRWYSSICQAISPEDWNTDVADNIKFLKDIFDTASIMVNLWNTIVYLLINLSETRLLPSLYR